MTTGTATASSTAGNGNINGNSNSQYGDPFLRQAQDQDDGEKRTTATTRVKRQFKGGVRWHRSCLI
jgi:hypothetical protein